MKCLHSCQLWHLSKITKCNHDRSFLHYNGAQAHTALSHQGAIKMFWLHLLTCQKCFRQIQKLKKGTWCKVADLPQSVFAAWCCTCMKTWLGCLVPVKVLIHWCLTWTGTQHRCSRAKPSPREEFNSVSVSHLSLVSSRRFNTNRRLRKRRGLNILWRVTLQSFRLKHFVQRIWKI